MLTRIRSLLQRLLPRPPQEMPDRPLEAALAQREDSIRARPNAPERFDIAGNLMRVTSGRTRRTWFGRVGRYLPGIQRDIVHSFTSVDHNPPLPRRRMRINELRAFEKRARALGIGAIGYTRLPREAIFKGKAVLFRHVIVLIMEMDVDLMAAAPSPATLEMVMQTYYELGRVTQTLVADLRARGFAAQAGHPLNGVTLYPLVAQKAGLGWCGDSGLLITPEFGPRQRIAVIYTSIENLPEAQENPHGWIADLCARCGQCRRKCPGQAIYDAPVAHANGTVTHIDVARCFPVFADQYGCSLCIKVCPFNLHSYAAIKRAMARRQPEAAPQPASAAPAPAVLSLDAYLRSQSIASVAVETGAHQPDTVKPTSH